MNCPQNVVTAVRLLYFSLAVELAGIIFSLSKELAYWNVHTATLDDPVFFSTVSCIGMMFLMLGVMAILTYKISKGFNLARVVFTSLFVLGLIQSIPMLFCIPAANALGTISYLLKVTAQGGAAYLLFSAPAVAWFRKGVTGDHNSLSDHDESQMVERKEEESRDPALSSVARITTAVLGGVSLMLLFMGFCVFVALENCPGGDGYNPNGSINKAFTEIEKQLNELNKK